jgi:hypothetical protein
LTKEWLNNDKLSSVDDSRETSGTPDSVHIKQVLNEKNITGY